jgi:hypothetical protein
MIHLRPWPGVGPLAAGQTVTIAVEGVGELMNPVG